MSDTKANTSANAKATEDRREAPDQARIDELARRFDRTGVGDPAEFEEVEDVIIERRPELAQVSVRPAEDLAALRQQADRAGIGYTTSIRMILPGYLNLTATHGAKRRPSFQAATPVQAAIPARDDRRKIQRSGVGPITAQQRS